jgi:hypothetical protein
MKSFVCWVMLGLFVLSVEAEPAGFSIEGIGAVGGGTLAYEIAASGDRGDIRSRLEFPMDGAYGGLQALYTSRQSYGRLQDFVFGVKFLTGLSDPGGDMNDYDWWNGEKIGDTQSEAESDSIQLDVFARAGMFFRDNLALSAVVGLRYENYQYDVYGVDGYYRPPIGNGHVFESSATRVLTYEMTHTGLYGGLNSSLAFNPSVALEGHVLLGMGYITDRDDHILRGKVSTSDYFSFSTEVAAYLVWYLLPETSSYRFYLKAGGEFNGLWGTGLQDQTFSDSTPDNTNIDADIDMIFASARAMLGCSF